MTASVSALGIKAVRADSLGHKKQDSISLSQFSEFTTLKKPRICHALQKLLSKMVITIAKNDNGITTYGFNKDFDKWLPLPKKVTLPKMAKGGAKKGNESLPLLGHTKETIQKKLLQKKGRSILMVDDQFWEEVRKIYTWIDIDHEIQKMKGYMLSPKGRRWRMTQQRVVEWFNRIDKPIEMPKTNKNQPPNINPSVDKMFQDAIKEGWK